MGISKKVNQIGKKKIDLESIFIFLFLIVFPFGQIIRLSFSLGGYTIPLLPIDVVVGLAGLYSLLFQKDKSKIYGYLRFFFYAAIFSFIVSLGIFGKEAFYGLFYLLRLTAYYSFLNYVWHFARKSKAARIILTDSLLAISGLSAVFGWFQFFLFPDIKAFFVYNWDMHLYRLVGTLLDPTYLGIIIVFGLITSLVRYFYSKEKKYLAISLFFLVSLAFTYSRASYLAFGAGVLVFAFLTKKFRKFSYWILGLLLIAYLLPTAKNRSIELTRTFSIFSRITNYGQTLEVFKRYPIFGVGYNNLCLARNQIIGVEDYASHSCSGSDSSLLFILASTGIVGFMAFLSAGYAIFRALRGSKEFYFFAPIAVSLLVHSLFSNSIFFPWVTGYIIVLLGSSLKE